MGKDYRPGFAQRRAPAAAAAQPRRGEVRHAYAGALAGPGAAFPVARPPGWRWEWPRFAEVHLKVAPESEFQDSLSVLATRAGWSIYHTFYSIKASSNGWPDLVLSRRLPEPRAVFAELKTDARPRAVSDAQKSWLWALAAAGLEATVWAPADVAVIFRVLYAGERAVLPGWLAAQDPGPAAHHAGLPGGGAADAGFVLGGG